LAAAWSQGMVKRGLGKKEAKWYAIVDLAWFFGYV
jgi:hypothetical protein